MKSAVHNEQAQISVRRGDQSIAETYTVTLNGEDAVSVTLQAGQQSARPGVNLQWVSPGPVTLDQAAGFHQAMAKAIELGRAITADPQLGEQFVVDDRSATSRGMGAAGSGAYAESA